MDDAGPRYARTFPASPRRGSPSVSQAIQIRPPRKLNIVVVSHTRQVPCRHRRHTNRTTHTRTTHTQSGLPRVRGRGRRAKWRRAFALTLTPPPVNHYPAAPLLLQICAVLLLAGAAARLAYLAARDRPQPGGGSASLWQQGGVCPNVQLRDRAWESGPLVECLTRTQRHRDHGTVSGRARACAPGECGGTIVLAGDSRVRLL